MTERQVYNLTKHIEPGYAVDIYFDTINNTYECSKIPANYQINLGDINEVFVARVLWPLDRASLNKAKEAAIERIRLEADKNGN